MRIAKAVTKALPNSTEPAAVLALNYADAIDQAAHVPLALAGALETLRRAAALADTDAGGDDAARAFDKIAAALATATILDKLGPKLLAALDALLITPKAKAAIAGGIDASRPPSPLDEFRNRHDTRHLRAAG